LKRFKDKISMIEWKLTVDRKQRQMLQKCNVDADFVDVADAIGV